MMKKKLFSGFLALAMIFVLLPAGVFAEKEKCTVTLQFYGLTLEDSADCDSRKTDSYSLLAQQVIATGDNGDSYDVSNYELDKGDTFGENGEIDFLTNNKTIHNMGYARIECDGRKYGFSEFSKQGYKYYISKNGGALSGKTGTAGLKGSFAADEDVVISVYFAELANIAYDLNLPEGCAENIETPKTYTNIFNSNSTYSFNKSLNGKIIEASDGTRYIFRGWATSAKAQSASVPESIEKFKIEDFIDANADVATRTATVYGVWRKILLSVESSVENGTITPTQNYFYKPARSTVHYSPKGKNYVLTDIIVDGEKIENVDLYPNSYTFESPLENHTIHVVYSLKEQVGVTVTVSGGWSGTKGDGSTGVKTAYVGDRIDLYVGANYQWLLQSAKLDGEDVELIEDREGVYHYTIERITKNHNLDVVFVPELAASWSVTTSCSNGSITPTDSDIKDNESFTAEYSPNEGYVLAKVIVDGEEVDIAEYPTSYTFENITQNHELEVVFVPELAASWSVTTSCSNGSITPTNSDIKDNGSFTAEYSPDEGYVLAKVIVDGEEVDIAEYPTSYTFDNVTQNHTINVICIKHRPEAAEGASVKVYHRYFNRNNTLVGEDGPYAFENGALGELIAMSGIDANTNYQSTSYSINEITVKRTRITYPLTFDLNGAVLAKESEELPNASYLFGEAITLPTDVMLDGVQFIGWSYEKDLDVALVEPQFVMPAEATTLYAVYEKLATPMMAAVPKLMIETQAGEGGSITETIADVALGNNITINFAPDECYEISSVVIDGVEMLGLDSGEDVADGDYTFANVTESHTISVEFEKTKFKVSASAANGNIFINGKEGTQIIAKGETVLIGYACDLEFLPKTIKVNGEEVDLNLYSEYYEIESINEDCSIVVIFPKDADDLNAKDDEEIIVDSGNAPNDDNADDTTLFEKIVESVIGNEKDSGAITPTSSKNKLGLAKLADFNKDDEGWGEDNTIEITEIDAFEYAAGYDYQIYISYMAKRTSRPHRGDDSDDDDNGGNEPSAITIRDESVPLASTIIIDEDVPLGNLPTTGSSSAYAAAAMGAAVLLLGVLAKRRK